jgi:hypothetical protein
MMVHPASRAKSIIFFELLGCFVEFPPFRGELILIFNQYKRALGGIEGEIGRHSQIGVGTTSAGDKRSESRRRRGKSCGWTTEGDSEDEA